MTAPELADAVGSTRRCAYRPIYPRSPSPDSFLQIKVRVWKILQLLKSIVHTTCSPSHLYLYRGTGFSPPPTRVPGPHRITAARHRRIISKMMNCLRIPVRQCSLTIMRSIPWPPFFDITRRPGCNSQSSTSRPTDRIRPPYRRTPASATRVFFFQRLGSTA